MAALCLIAALSVQTPIPDAEPAPEAIAADATPDLGLVRFAWPRRSRELWFGAGFGGIYLPSELTGFSRDAWTARTPLSWSLALGERLKLGGRHAMVWYDSTDARTRLGEHSGEVAIVLGPLDAGRQSRISITGSMRELDKFRVNESGVELAVGGIRDAIIGFGYSGRFVVGQRWALGVQAHLRHAWVFTSTQRQVRAAFQTAYYPHPRQSLALTLTGHLVHRDTEQYAKELTRLTPHGQLSFGYAWLSAPLTTGDRPFHLGGWLNLRGATSFLSGEAPVYEVRNDGLTTPYADAALGIHARW